MKEPPTELRSTPAILLVKVGSHPELASLAKKIRSFSPDARIYGIGTENTTEDDIGVAVANENEVGLANHREWWEQHLYVQPELYERLRAREAHLLRLSERIAEFGKPTQRRRTSPWSIVESDVSGRARVTLRSIAFWDWILSKNQIDAVVFGALPHNYWDAVLYEVAVARGIDILIFSSNRPFLDSIYLAESPWKIGDLQFGQSVLSIADEKFGLVKDSEGRRARMLKSLPCDEKQQLPSNTRGPRVRLVDFLSKVLTVKNLSPKRLVASITRRVRSFIENRERQLLASKKILPKSYFLVELQRPNNSATQVRGYMYRTPREMIAHISDNLPSGVKLVVRETSRSRAERTPRPRGFWREIAALPSVLVASDELDSERLLREAVGLIELSYSTLAMHAVCLGVPVIVLGFTHLGGLPNTHVITELSDLKTVLDLIAGIGETTVHDSLSRERGIQGWLDETRRSTLEGNLSSDNFTGENNATYRYRLVNNVAAVIVAWYESCVRNGHGDHIGP